MSSQATLEQMASQAKVIQDFARHPGMKLLVDKLDQKCNLKRNAWLNCEDPIEAEKIRQSTRAYAALMGLLNEFLAHGSQAEKQLAVNANTNDSVSNDMTNQKDK